MWVDWILAGEEDNDDEKDGDNDNEDNDDDQNSQLESLSAQMCESIG